MTREERAKDYAEHNIDKYTNDFANLYNAYIKGAKEETKELEQENAELRNRNSKLAGQKASLERWYGEAKKILTKLLEEEKNNMYWEMNGSDKSSYYEVRKQAEQFLNSEVEQ